MGGTVIETESDKIKIQTIIELGQEVGLDDAEILKKLQEKIIGLPLTRATAYGSQAPTMCLSGWWKNWGSLWLQGGTVRT